MSEQETGKKVLWVEREHGGHAGNLAPEMHFVEASPSEIIEAARTLPGAKVLHARNGPQAKRLAFEAPGRYLVIPIEGTDQ